MVRAIAVAICLLAAVPALAGEMSADEARRFVIGKLFSYTCFEGTRGQGRVMADGSVNGSIQIRGAGHVRYAALPAGTLRVKGEAVCASLRGLPIEPCFNLVKHDDNSFRGSVSGFGFMYCEFTHNSGRPHILRHRNVQKVEQKIEPKAEPKVEQKTEQKVEPKAVQKTESKAEPLTLRPSLTADNAK